MKNLVFALAAFATLCAALPALGAEKEQVPCAVCGYLIDKDSALRAEYEGTTYYFCEAGCKAYFLMNPAAFAEGNDIDPVCGMTVKKDGSASTVYKGRVFHFCSEGCKTAFLAKPGDFEMDYDVVSNEVKPAKEMPYTTKFDGRPYRFASKANMKAFTKNPNAYVYAECPVCGKVFLRKDAAAKKLYKGATYCFCCTGCRDQFTADPGKYMGPAKGAAAEGCKHTGVKPEDCQKKMESGQCPHMKPKKG